MSYKTIKFSFFLVILLLILAAFYVFLNLEKEVVLPPKEVTLELPDGIYEKQDQILLAPTSKDWPRLKTTFQKQDLTELSRLFGEGVLSVPIGTKAKTIKKRNGVVLVEIIESGRQGWIGEEFVK